METPDVTRFPDGHFRRTIYGIGPYIADYPEQVMLSGVVQRWCPRYDKICFIFVFIYICASQVFSR